MESTQKVDVPQSSKMNRGGKPKSKDSKHKDFNKTTGAVNNIPVSTYYEIKLIALLLLRAIQTGKEFYIASNMAAGGKFDDLILWLDDHSIFMQLKHKETPKRIQMNQLAFNKDFKLSKYLQSFLDISSQWQEKKELQNCGVFENSVFVLYTNAPISECFTKDFKRSIKVGNTELLSLINTGGKYVIFEELFQNLGRYKNILNEADQTGDFTNTSEILEVVKALSNAKATEVPHKNKLKELLSEVEALGDLSRYQTFLSHFYFYADQAPENKLNECIKKDMRTMFGTDKMFDKLYAGVEKWWKKPKMNLTEGAQFWQEILQDSVANVIKKDSNLNVKFDETCLKTIRDSLSRVLFIETSCMHFTGWKAKESLGTEFLVDDSILGTRLSEVMALWKLGAGGEVLIVESTSMKEEVIQEFVDLLDSSQEKKLVMISDTLDPLMIKLFEKFGFKCISDNFSFKQLDEQSQLELLRTEVIFQGSSVTLESLADKSFLEEAINEDILVNLLKTDGKLKVGNEIKDEGKYYIPRTLVRKEFLPKRFVQIRRVHFAVSGMSHDELDNLILRLEGDMNEFNNISNFTIIDSFDEYKHLCRKHRNVHWVHKSSEGFVWKHSSNDIEAVEHLLQERKKIYSSVEEILESHQQIFETQFEQCLFEYQVTNGGNVAVLFDGYDEISPHFSGRVLMLMKDLIDTKIRKIFVTSRPVMRKELEPTFSTLSFSLLPFTSLEQTTFMLKFWDIPHVLHNSEDRVVQFIESLLECSKKSVVDVFQIGIPLETVLLATVFRNDAWDYYRTGKNRLPRRLRVLDLYSKFIDHNFEFYCRKFGVEPTNIMVIDRSELQKANLEKDLMACALVTLLDDDSHILWHPEYRELLEINNKFIAKCNAGLERLGIVTEVVNNKAVFLHRTFAEYFAGLWLSTNIVNRSKFCKKVYTRYPSICSFCDRFLAEEHELHLSVVENDVSSIEKLVNGNAVDVNSVDRGGRTALHLCMRYFDDNIESNLKNLQTKVAEILLQNKIDTKMRDNIFCLRPLQLAQEFQAFGMMDLLLKEGADKSDIILWKYSEVNWSLRKILRVSRIRGIKQTFIDIFTSKESISFLDHLVDLAIYFRYFHLLQFLFECGVKPERRLHILSLGNIRETRNLPYGPSPFFRAVIRGDRAMVELMLKYVVDIEKRYGSDRGTVLMCAVKAGFVEIADILIKNGACVNAINFLNESVLCIARQEENEDMVQMLLQNGAKSHNIT
ncbi:hypothetical protein C0J52_15297 [Blattella germanica]|nr:hypothetical protein C0J52_15297 [Blattella germanica]